MSPNLTKIFTNDSRSGDKLLKKVDHICHSPHHSCWTSWWYFGETFLSPLFSPPFSYGTIFFVKEGSFILGCIHFLQFGKNKLSRVFGFLLFSMFWMRRFPWWCFFRRYGNMTAFRQIKFPWCHFHYDDLEDVRHVKQSEESFVNDAGFPLILKTWA